MTTTRPTLLLLAFLVPAFPASGAQSQPVRSDQENLIKLERDWDAAFHRRDVAFIEGVLAEEFVSTYGDGTRGDRAKELKLAAEFNQQIDSSTLDEFVVKVYGDTAVVWFTQHMVGPSKGQRLEGHLRTLVRPFVVEDVLRDDVAGGRSGSA
jgi:ketosteroid isomerase-like protein